METVTFLQLPWHIYTGDLMVFERSVNSFLRNNDINENKSETNSPLISYGALVKI